MAKNKELPHFRDKLVLNAWLISLFGIDPLKEDTIHDKKVRPCHKLTKFVAACPEGMGEDNLHLFYHHLDHSLFHQSNRVDQSGFLICRETLLKYEQNIVQHTQALNNIRERPIVWKYYQWLALLFVEIYLDRFFSSRETLLNDLNAFMERFNTYLKTHWKDHKPIPPYQADDLNKICLQCATGSGKTLLMHVNLLQYQHYAKHYGKQDQLSRVILLTPNERLSEQHVTEFWESDITADRGLSSRDPLSQNGLRHVNVLEITKLADQEGPNTIATRSLGDQNLLLVDEGHRGMSGKKDEGVWFTRRSELCAQGFTFEYSATFEQAVGASSNEDFENNYAKTILFDYSYRWFYEDGFGKDYQILNLPKTLDYSSPKKKPSTKKGVQTPLDVQTQSVYITACLLKFYQQLRIYEENTKSFKLFHIEKPLWVFVGSTVMGKGCEDAKQTISDVALILFHLADFLKNSGLAIERIRNLLLGTGQDSGLIDKDGRDIFAGAFAYLARAINGGETVESLYHDILTRLFHGSSGGHLSLKRVPGESGEVLLCVGNSETPFGLINVGDAKGLCDGVESMAKQKNISLTVEESKFTEASFASVKSSDSSINVLIGSKKFVEGWDCWRVSTMGLMHVGKSEGAQIIQLFGRGVRLKGYEWSLKRSCRVNESLQLPPFISELETLHVFGIGSDFMSKFREFLKSEGLPGNENRRMITIPLNVTYHFGKKLKVIRPKRKTSDGREYDFKKDAAVPTLGQIPDYMFHHPVVVDWYPRIATIRSTGIHRSGDQDATTVQAIRKKNEVTLGTQHLVWLDYDALFLGLEQFKRERGWHNLNITKKEIRDLLESGEWYTLYLPENYEKPTTFDDVHLLQQVVMELLKRYSDFYYNYRKREFMEPRLELRDLTSEDANIPKEQDYQIIVDDGAEQVIANIQQIKRELEQKKDCLLKLRDSGDLRACCFSKHLFEPLFHVQEGGKITVLPVVLNESEYQFVKDLMKWCETQSETLEGNGVEIYLLRNLSRGKGIGFFEADNFHPDFILWMLHNGKQYVTFVEPHGLLHEGSASKKILLHEQIKHIEKRLDDSSVILNSFILSCTSYSLLKWGKTQEELERMHVLFMDDSGYISKLFTAIEVNEYRGSMR